MKVAGEKEGEIQGKPRRFSTCEGFWPTDTKPASPEHEALRQEANLKKREANIKREPEEAKTEPEQTKEQRKKEATARRHAAHELVWKENRVMDGGNDETGPNDDLENTTEKLKKTGLSDDKQKSTTDGGARQKGPAYTSPTGSWHKAPRSGPQMGGPSTRECARRPRKS